jgi:hypothetical protein
MLRLLASEPVRSDTRNHACPVLDVVPLDGVCPVEVVVYPLARDWRMPPIRLVVEALPFIDQLLEVCIIFQCFFVY